MASVKERKKKRNGTNITKMIMVSVVEIKQIQTQINKRV